MHPRIWLLAALLAIAARYGFGQTQSPTLIAGGGRLQSGRIFAAESYSGAVLPIYDITRGQLSQFAQLSAGGWIGPLAVRPDGRLFAVTNAQNGSLWDITAGGDLSGAQPLAGNLYPQNLGYLEGLAFDSGGNAFITNSEAGTQQIAKVTPAGAVSYLPPALSQPRGLLVNGGTLYVAESGAGRVLAIDLASGQATLFATGFTAGADHTAAQMAIDGRGHLLLLWAAGGDYGLFDISNGGAFSGQAPLVTVPFRIDVNQIAVDGANNVYAAGDDNDTVYISRFNGAGFGPFAQFVGGVGDTESVAIVP